ncbi:MAG: NADH:ubiquinone reductase (Na(+)-transporting) subunit B [Flavobacteriales bacterium]|nr:NADH:ubiquinone reductase (Na(+)-transporting) subunit B [Flavobacteriales bacterium]
MKKLLRNFFDGIKPNFEKGGKFEKFHPALDAFETFVFVPGETTHSGAHIRDGIDLKRTMFFVIIALVPSLLFGMYNIGFQHYSQLGEEFTLMSAFLFGLWKVLPMIVISYGVGLGIEFLFAIIRGHQVNEGYLVTGMLIPLIMPVDLPLWMLAVAVVFAVIIGKEVFGGTGMNILNPALTARAFLFFAYPTYMSGNAVWVADAGTVDAISGETILGGLAAAKEVLSQAAAGTGYDSWTPMEAFLGLIPGSVGETSTLAIILGAAFLLWTGIGSWRIMLSGLLGASLMGLIFNAFSVNLLMATPWYEHLVIGGFAFGLVFMATDPVSAAQTTKGKWIYGFLVGFFAIMIRVFNPAYPEGIMLAILLMNVFAPLIDHYVVQANVKKRMKRMNTAKA